MASVHESVLLKETVEGLGLHPDKEATAIDCTFGGGGHSLYLLNNYPKVHIVALDQDSGAWNRAESKFSGKEKQIKFLNKNFREINTLSLQVDAVMMDLGLSSDQLDISGRGFSFMRNEPLLMTMQANPTADDLTAKDIVNNWSEENITIILKGYGEEKFAKRIAHGIKVARETKSIETTFDLVDIIKNSVPVFYSKAKINPATKTFQALRMAVNDELNTLESGLRGAFQILKSGGHLAVISFHSGEDRIVKNFFKEKAINKEGVLINKKPIIPSGEEIKNNKRSRSAKLRIIQKI